MSICLTEQELIDVTRKQRFKAQAKALRSMGIDFTLRPDGSPLVSREVYERAVGGATKPKAKAKSNPDFGAFQHA